MKMLYFLIALVLGWFGGWVYTHNIIAQECEKLGSFYVGNKVFECKLKQDAKK